MDSNRRPFGRHSGALQSWIAPCADGCDLLHAWIGLCLVTVFFSQEEKTVGGHIIISGFLDSAETPLPPCIGTKAKCARF
jgi:hypothetical protein